MAADKLKNPTKSRAKGPAGRKLPTRRARTEEEEEEDRTSDRVPVWSQEKFVDLDLVGKMNSEEFDRVWFLKVPSISSLLSSGSSDQNKEEKEKEKEEVVNNNNIKVKSEEEKVEISSEVEESEPEDCDKPEEEKVKGKKRWKNCVIL